MNRGRWIEPTPIAVRGRRTTIGELFGKCSGNAFQFRYINVVSLENRIKRSFEAINKLGESNRTFLSAQFCQLKYDELYLAYEYQEKKLEEKEEQLRIREQMREEEKVAVPRESLEEAVVVGDLRESLLAVY